MTIRTVYLVGITWITNSLIFYIIGRVIMIAANTIYSVRIPLNSPIQIRKFT